VQRGTQRHHHRPAKGVGRQLGALEDGSVGPAYFSATRRESTREHDIRDAELPERRDRVWREAQPEAELPWRRRAFEDADVPAGLAQGDPCRQAADTRADNEGGARDGLSLAGSPRQGEKPAYGTTAIGVCQKAALFPVGSITLT
jgi:hypothetical protein